MISDKVVLTYKRKRSFSHSDPTHVQGEDSPSQSPENIQLTRSSQKDEHGSAGSSEQLKGDDKSMPHGRGQCTTCVQQCDDAGEDVQQQIQESDGVLKSCRSVQELERGLMKLHSQSSSHSKIGLGKDTSFSNNSESIDVKCASTNGTLCTIETVGSQLLELDNVERSSPISFISTTGSKCSSACTENFISQTYVSGEKEISFKNMEELVCHDTVHKVSFGTPLVTYFRRAKRRKNSSEIDAENNSKVGTGESSLSDQSKNLLDAICSSEGPKDQLKEAPVLAQDNSGSNPSSFHLDGKVMAENFESSKKPSPPGVEEKKSEESSHDCTDRSNLSDLVPMSSKKMDFTIEDTPVQLKTNCCSSNSMQTSDVSIDGKQIKPPEIGTSIGEEPTISLIDAVQKPAGGNITDEISKTRNSLHNLFPSDTDFSEIHDFELAPKKPATDSSLEASKQMGDASHRNMLDPQSSSNHAMEESNKRISLNLLQTMRTQEERIKCLSLQEVGITSGRVSGRDALYHMPMNSSLPDPTALDLFRETHNQTVSPHERDFVRNMGDFMFKRRHGIQTTRIPVGNGFLGLALNQSEDNVDPKGIRCTGPISCLSVEATDHSHQVQLPWKALDCNSSWFRHKQILDDILTSSRMLDKRQTYLTDSRRHPITWSEDELDSLWIGVRRHGRGNWIAMLGDPKLHFSGWKIPEDLAERWDMEQSRLLSAPLVQPVRSLEADHCLSSIMSGSSLLNSTVGSYSSHDSCPPLEFQALRNENGLSLGDVYLKREGKTMNRNQLPDVNTVYPLVTNGSLVAGSSCTHRGHQRCSFSPTAGGRCQRLSEVQKKEYAWGASMLEQNSVERLFGSGQQMASLSASTNLPHWLKEVLCAPPVLSEPPLLSNISTSDQSTVLLYGDPKVIPTLPQSGEKVASLRDTRRGILKRTGTSHNTAGSLNASTSLPPVCKPSVVSRFNLPSLVSSPPRSMDENKVANPNIFDLNHSLSEPMGHNNLVILDSDASSEETISDDQSSRR